MKVTMADTVLHPFPVNDDPHDDQSYALRFEKGESYDVESNVGQYFISNGWADNAARDVDLSEPFDTREATDEEAERLEREVHAPAREASNVQTVPPTELEVQDSSSGASANF